MYLFLAVVVGGPFVALWKASDFFTAVLAWQFLGPVLILMSIDPSMRFGKVFAAVVRSWEGWFKSKGPPHSSASGDTLHAPI